MERFLIPHMGQFRLSDLDTRRLRAIFAEIAATKNGKGVPQSTSCLQHLRTTLRAVLNLAVREAVLAVTAPGPRPRLRGAIRSSGSGPGVDEP